MDPSPYYAPTYFSASYFYSATVPTSDSTPTGLLPYNAPTYFAPSYFYGPSSSTTASTGLLPYNSPTYFAPSYFYGPSSTTVNVPVTPDPTPTPTPDPTPTPTPDPAPTPAPVPIEGVHDSYSTLIALLEATGVFEDVIFGAAIQRSQAGSDTYPLAILTPQGWEESDDVDPTSIVHRVTFSITVVVTSQDALPQFDQLNRLTSAIKKAVDGSDLDGTCLPALTRIRSGHYVYSNRNPEQSIDLEGEFSSIINPVANVPATS
jgi:hypothetical protein